MNKKGFTLIEGLMVIAIIGVILLTLIPSVIVIINKNKQKSFESTRDSIIAAAKMYVAENKYDNTIIPIDCNGKNEVYIDVPLDKLSGYGNLSTIPEGFPDIEIKFDCQEKEFDYTYEKSSEAGKEHPLYNSLTLDDVKETNAENNNGNIENNSNDTIYNIDIVRVIANRGYTGFNGYKSINGNDIELELDSESATAQYWEQDSKCDNGAEIEYISSRTVSQESQTDNDEEDEDDEVQAKVILKFKIKNITSDDKCTITILPW